MMSLIKYKFSLFLLSSRIFTKKGRAMLTINEINTKVCLEASYITNGYFFEKHFFKGVCERKEAGPDCFHKE